MREYRRRLPHFQPDNTYLFLTWRLWGTLPAARGGLNYPSPGHAFAAADRAMDTACSGPRWLADTRIAPMVFEAIRYGEVERTLYEVDAFVIMPNHVHLLVLPSAPTTFIMRWLKAWTAREANRLLRRVGKPFWQDESYDHWVRDGKERSRIANYIEWNPVKAGLAETPEQYPWSSAAGRY